MAIIEPSGVQQAGTLLAQSAVAVSHTGDTNEAVLATIAVPANAIGKNGYLTIAALASMTNSANSKTFRLRFGAVGSGIAGTALSSASLTSTASDWMRSFVANRSAANSQVAHGSLGSYTAGSAASTGAIDTTAATEINITGQLASAAETITLESYQVLLYFHA